MGFNEYINELLFEHNCVIVPGFGGLVANAGKARINTLTSQIFPPCKTIAFNQNLIQNDGLLANLLVRKEGITYEQAMNRIADYSQGIQNNLRKKNSFTLSGIGDFYLNNEGSVQFKPSEDSTHLYDTFGMGAITLPELVSKPETLAAGNSRRMRIRRLRWVATSAAACIILAACIFSFRSGLFRLDDNIVTLNPFDTLLGNDENNDSVTEKETEVIVIPPAVTEKETLLMGVAPAVEGPEVTVPEFTEVPEALLAITEGRKFIIIGGAFSSKYNAARYRKFLSGKGFSAELAGQNSTGLTRVSYAEYTDSAEAVRQLQIIKSNENQNAWILAQ